MNDLPIWTIYDHPQDHPQLYIARKWLIGRGKVTPTGDVRAGLTLAEVRRKLPAGLVRMARHPADDPKIVETWL